MEQKILAQEKKTETESLNSIRSNLTEGSSKEDEISGGSLETNLEASYFQSLLNLVKKISPNNGQSQKKKNSKQLQIYAESLISKYLLPYFNNVDDMRKTIKISDVISGLETLLKYAPLSLLGIKSAILINLFVTIPKFLNNTEISKVERNRILELLMRFLRMLLKQMGAGKYQEIVIRILRDVIPKTFSVEKLKHTIKFYLDFLKLKELASLPAETSSKFKRIIGDYLSSYYSRIAKVTKFRFKL